MGWGEGGKGGGGVGCSLRGYKNEPQNTTQKAMASAEFCCEV